MTSIIHSYLYEHFIFVDGKIRSKSAYARSQEPFRFVYFNDTLSNIIEELSLIFALTKKQLKYYVKGWVRKHNRGFDFERYWNPPPFDFNTLAFPKIKRIYSRTIGLDLARVEPMQQPRGLLNWIHVGNTMEELNRELEEVRIERHQRIIDVWDAIVNPNRG